MSNWSAQTKQTTECQTNVRCSIDWHVLGGDTNDMDQQISKTISKSLCWDSGHMTKSQKQTTHSKGAINE